MRGDATSSSTPEGLVRETSPFGLKLRYHIRSLWAVGEEPISVNHKALKWLLLWQAIVFGQKGILHSLSWEVLVFQKSCSFANQDVLRLANPLNFVRLQIAWLVAATAKLRSISIHGEPAIATPIGHPTGGNCST